MPSCTLSVSPLAALLAVTLAGQQSHTAGHQQRQPVDQHRPPVFRTGTNLVQVDAFPSRDGRIVEGLTAGDFEILEDGRRQTIKDVQFVRIDVNTPIGERQDPNTQAEANRLAADPRNRVFVVYLDHYHINLEGSHRTRRPLVGMLNRLLTASDLFGVMTPLLRPGDLILGRRTETLEEQLAKHWAWGAQPDFGMPIYPEAHEELLVQCYGKVRRGRQERRGRESPAWIHGIASASSTSRVVVGPGPPDRGRSRRGWRAPRAASRIGSKCRRPLRTRSSDGRCSSAGARR